MASTVNEHLISNTLQFHDGHSIPIVGLGTYLKSRCDKFFRDKDCTLSPEQIEQDLVDDEKEETEFRKAVFIAVQNGYRHIDTAQGIDTFPLISDVYSSCDVSVNI